MNTEQERADFEAWMRDNHPGHRLIFVNGYIYKWTQRLWEAYQAGRASLQSQSMPPEISRDLLGKIVDEVFDGAIEDASVIEDIYRVVARECALQSQDREGAFCVWHNDPETDNSWNTGCRQLFELYDGTPSENRMSFCCYCGKPIQEVIDQARRIEGET